MPAIQLLVDGCRCRARARFRMREDGREKTTRWSRRRSANGAGFRRPVDLVGPHRIRANRRSAVTCRKPRLEGRQGLGAAWKQGIFRRFGRTGEAIPFPGQARSGAVLSPRRHERRGLLSLSPSSSRVGRGPSVRADAASKAEIRGLRRRTIFLLRNPRACARKRSVQWRGRSSGVEHYLAKVRVVSSNLIARSSWIGESAGIASPLRRPSSRRTVRCARSAVFRRRRISAR